MIILLQTTNQIGFSLIGGSNNGGGCWGRSFENQYNNPSERFCLAVVTEDDDTDYDEEEIPAFDLTENQNGSRIRPQPDSVSASGVIRNEISATSEDKDMIPPENESRINSMAAFYVADISSPSLPIGKGIPTLEDLTANLKTQIGFYGTRTDLSEDLMSLTQTGMFENVEADIHPVDQKNSSDAVHVIFKFATRDFAPMESFHVEGASILPPDTADKVMAEYKKRGGGIVDLSTLALIRDIVEGFYENYPYTYITHFEGLEGGHVKAYVNEGRVRAVKVVPLDSVGNATAKCENNLQMITHDLRKTIVEGELFNSDDTRKALRDVYNTQMFEFVQVHPKPQGDLNSSPVIDVDILVRERPAMATEIEIDWQLQSNENGGFSLLSPSPGGSMVFAHRNLGGNGTQVSASISTQNFLMPGEDIGLKLDCKKPYLFGTNDRKKTCLDIAAFNTHKRSAIFASNSGVEVSPLWMTRYGIKACLTETYTRRSKGIISLIAESIECRDESGAPCTTCQFSSFDGLLLPGPPTTMTDSGSDKVLFLRGDIIRDTSYMNGGSTIGTRQIFSVEQGLGIGSLNPFFNRHIMSFTHYLPLRGVPVKKNSPATLVLHGKFGDCVGDIASYDFFTLGGPASCRGYEKGELGSARRFIEFATEMRYPLLYPNGQVYSFVELTDSMGSGNELPGKPNDVFRLDGKGSSWGYGIKYGVTRLEYARDCNMGTGNCFIRFGERF